MSSDRSFLIVSVQHVASSFSIQKEDYPSAQEVETVHSFESSETSGRLNDIISQKIVIFMDILVHIVL
jgi:hypothetical protein